MKLRRALLLLLILPILFAPVARAGVLTLPDSLAVIETRAFYGSSAIDTVNLPNSVTRIESYAFANSSITTANLPTSIKYIADTAFSGCDNLIISAKTGSYAYNWAKGKGFTVIDSSIKYRALLIGNTYPGTYSELPGPDNDVEGMKTMLKMQSSTPYAINTRINVTCAQMKSAITSTFKDADSDDVSLFFYSGHGTNYGEICGTANTYLTIGELRECLDKIPGTKIVLLDCCYSGAYIDKTKEPVDFNDTVKSVFSACPRANLAADKYIVMTACTKKQTASSLGFGKVDGEVFWFGAFTYSLVYGSGYNMYYQTPCTSWADFGGNRDGKTTLMEAYVDAKDTIEQVLLCRHTPQYYGDPSFVLWEK